MLPQGLEEWITRICSIPRGLQVILHSDESHRVQGDALELLTLAERVNGDLIPVGLQILDLEIEKFGLS